MMQNRNNYGGRHRRLKFALTLFRILLCQPCGGLVSFMYSATTCFVFVSYSTMSTMWWFDKLSCIRKQPALSLYRTLLRQPCGGLVNFHVLDNSLSPLLHILALVSLIDNQTGDGTSTGGAVIKYLNITIKPTI